MTSASVASASITSPGKALSSRTPSGSRHRPPVPSTSCPYRAWFYRLRRPHFWPERAAVQELLLPLQQAFAIERTQQRSGTHPALPTASIAASRSQVTDTCRAKTATPHPSATPTGCPPDTRGWTPKAGLACPCAASARAAADISTPTAPHSITGIASCSCKKFIKPAPHAEVPSLRPNLFMKHALVNLIAMP